MCKMATLSMCLIVLAQTGGVTDLAREVIATMPFGERPTQVPVWYNHEMGDVLGMAGLAVAGDGHRLYLLCQRIGGLPCRALTVDEGGKVLTSTDLSSWLEDATGIVTVGPSIFVVGTARTNPPTIPWSEGPRGLLVLNHRGRLQNQIRRSDLPPSALPPSAHLSAHLEVAASGELVWRFTGHDLSSGALMFDATARFLRTSRWPYQWGRSGGEVKWECHETGVVTEVTLVGKDNIKVRRLRVPTEVGPVYPLDLDRLDSDQWQVLLSTCSLGQTGWSYLVAARDTPHGRTVDLNAFPAIWGKSSRERVVDMGTELMVLAYSPDEAFAGRAVFSANPFCPMPYGYTCDASGALYQTDFYGDHIDVVRWSAAE